MGGIEDIWSTAGTSSTSTSIYTTDGINTTYTKDSQVTMDFSEKEPIKLGRKASIDDLLKHIQ